MDDSIQPATPKVAPVLSRSEWDNRRIRRQICHFKTGWNFIDDQQDEFTLALLSTSCLYDIYRLL